MMRRKGMIEALTVVFLGAMSAVAFASGGGEGHGYDWMGFFWQVVNFAILITVILVFGRKTISEFFRSRSEAIQKTLDEAREARELAEQALAKVEERLKRKDGEVAEILAISEQAGQKEREALIKEGERLSRKLLEQGRANMDYELKQAREAIKAEAVELAMELAEKKIKGELGESEQKKLFEEALGRLEGRS